MKGMNMADLPVPFFGNTDDDMHCFQAALRSVLAYLLPDRMYDWKELDEITAHAPSLYTWPLAGALYCASQGLKVHWIEAFDYGRFSREGYTYLVEFYGQEVADDQRKNSDIEAEMDRARQLLDVIDVEARIPAREDLVSHIKSGQPVIANVNSMALNDRQGYFGHFVVVKGIDENNVVLHDPGLPPKPSRYVSWRQFDQAWAYPEERSRNLIALR